MQKKEKMMALADGDFGVPDEVTPFDLLSESERKRDEREFEEGLGTFFGIRDEMEIRGVISIENNRAFKKRYGFDHLGKE